MDDERIHRATSHDGTEIAGRVQGQGPSLVFVHGGAGDGEVSWRALAQLLSEEFTCYLMSTRGRASSADHPDHSRERLIEDIAAFAESIGSPLGLVGHSSGGALALEAAARSPAASALALYEPTVFDLGARDSARDADAFARLAKAVEEGRPADAVRIFLQDVALATDEEIAALSEEGAFDRMASNLVCDLEEAGQSGPPRISDLSLLERLRMPVLLLHGSRTAPFYKSVASSLARRLADARAREIPGVAHLAPQVDPAPVARELRSFFANARAAG